MRGFSWWNETWQNDANPAHDSEMRVQAIPNLSSAFTTRLKTSSVVVDRPIIK
jgi:hypothetical protein